MVTMSYKDLSEMTKRPDVVCVEMMTNRSMVYISTLAMNGNGRLPENMNICKVPIKTERPNFILRTEWDKMPIRTRRRSYRFFDDDLA